MAFDPTEPQLTIQFDNVEQARAFKVWLSNSGEQQFWEACEYDIDPKVSEHVPKHTDYHGDPNVVRFSAQPLERT